MASRRTLLSRRRAIAAPRRGPQRGAAVALLLAVAAGCVRAQIVPTDGGSGGLDAPRDGGPEIDAGALDDVGPALDARVESDAGDGGGTDAGPTDAGAPDAGGADAGDSRLLFADDFGSDPLATAGPRWTITNAAPDSWHWHAASETMRSGPGLSCVYWGNRTTKPGPYWCDEGPAMIVSPAFDLPADGQVTLDVDVYSELAPFPNEGSFVALHYAGPPLPGWQLLPGGEFEFTDLDHMAMLSFYPTTVDRWVTVSGASRIAPFWSPTNSVRYDLTAIRPYVWFHLHAELCGTSALFEVTERDTGTLVLRTTPPAAIDVTPPGYYSQLRVLLMAEGPQKLFDNLVVRRGCGP